MYVLAFAALGIILLVGVGAVFAFGGGGSSNATSRLIQTGSCTEEEFKGLTPAHLQDPDAPVKYNSFPPSSGPHYAQPAPWSIYPDSVKQTILVHNLEHGGIVIQYGDVSEETVKEIRSFYQDDPYGVVVTPYPRLEKKIALTAWNEPGYERNQSEPGEVDAGNGYVLTCTEWDADAAAKFRDERRNKAGERYGSVQDMAPGS